MPVTVVLQGVKSCKRSSKKPYFSTFLCPFTFLRAQASPAVDFYRSCHVMACVPFSSSLAIGDLRLLSFFMELKVAGMEASHRRVSGAFWGFAPQETRGKLMTPSPWLLKIQKNYGLQ